MELDALEIKFEVYDETVHVKFVQKNGLWQAYVFNLDKLEEFQGRLAIAAAKLRGKLAKEATSQ